MALHSITSGSTQCLRMVQLIVLSFPWGKLLQGDIQSGQKREDQRLCIVIL